MIKKQISELKNENKGVKRIVPAPSGDPKDFCCVDDELLPHITQYYGYGGGEIIKILGAN